MVLLIISFRVIYSTDIKEVIYIYMDIPKREVIEMLRKSYQVGTRIELVTMDDFQAPPIGTKGTVRGVDDMGNILVNWDNGSSLNVVYGIDAIRKI